MKHCRLTINTANNLTFSDIQITTAESKNASVICNPDALDAEDEEVLGFECQNGQYAISSSSESTGGDIDAANLLAASVLTTTVSIFGATVWLLHW